MQLLCESMRSTRSDDHDDGSSVNNDEISPKQKKSPMMAAEDKMSSPVNSRPPSFILQPRKVPNRDMIDKLSCQDPAIIIGSFENSVFDEDVVHGITDTSHLSEGKSPLAITCDGQDSNLGNFPHESLCFESLQCSPSKKQKTLDRLGIQHSSPDTSFSENSVDDSCDDIIVPSLKHCGVLEGPTSTRDYDDAHLPFSPVPTFSDRNLSFRNDSDRIIPSTSPFTPQCRGMLQKLNISSPSSIVATSSPPDMSKLIPPDSKRPTPKNELKFDTIDSPAWRSYGQSNSACIADGTPNRIPVASSSNSPFQPCQKRHMRHHSGSSFKALPPRLHTLSNPDGNVQPTGTFSSSSSYTTSPSPRIVPLTVLSRNGTPVKTPEFVGATPTSSAKLEAPILGGTSNGKSKSLMSSPLMRSLDHDKELEDEENRIYENEQQMMKCNTSEKVASPNLDIRISRDINKYHKSSALPKIKLTPRTRMKARKTNGGDKEQFFPTLETFRIGDPLDDVDDCVALPIFSPNDSSVILSPMQKKLLHRSDKSNFVAAEDEDEFDFVSGFDKHSASVSNGGDTDFFEDDAEIMELANASSSPAMLRLSSTTHTAYKRNYLRSDFSSSDGDNSFTSAENGKTALNKGLPPRAPVPSITLHSFDQSGTTPSRNESTVSRALCLPRPVPMPLNKSRSLLYASSADDPIVRILRAEAIAEASRSNEPLTDDDSDADDSGFFLSSPQFSSVNGAQPAPRQSHSFRQKSDFRDSKISERNGDKAKIEPKPVGPATAHLSQLRASPPVTDCKGTTQVRTNFTQQSKAGFSFAPMPMSSCLRAASDATSSSIFSFSDCDSVDDMFSPKHHRRKHFVSFDDSNESRNNQSRGRESVNSILSISSLHGLDIVNESCDQLCSKIPQMPRDAASSSTYVKPMRSELSLNSLGLSVDSYSDFGMSDRNLSTPDLIISGHNRTALSPPSLKTPSPPL
ncbi:hypothetical protein ACHAXS_011734 [Conticribra weissflogii]